MLQNFLRLKESEDGSVMPLIGLAAFVLIGSMGFAIDLGRAQLVQAKLLNSADAAGLAVGARMSAVDLSAEARKFVDANFPDGYANATVTSVSAVANEGGSLITINASATVPTTLMQLLGIDEVDVSVTSQISRQTTGLELVLVLDNTGSMNGYLDDLQDAANDLVDIVFGPDDDAPNLFVGVVPFTQTVNVGTGKAAWMKPNTISSKNWGSSSWGGCVDASTFNDLDGKDQPPNNNNRKYDAYYFPDTSPDDGTFNSWIRDNGNYSIYNSGTSSRGPNAYCPSVVTPMTPTKSQVVAGINAMELRGGTHVNVGAVWGWRMLSPKWQTYWGGDMDANDLPLAYDAPKMEKAMVLMTDGENTFEEYNRTAYGNLSDGNLGTTNRAVAEGELDERLTTVCNAMKDAGIIIYAVAFRNPGTDIEELLENCASQPDFYFDSPTAEELATAFQTIGDSLSNLRVSR